MPVPHDASLAQRIYLEAADLVISPLPLQLGQGSRIGPQMVDLVDDPPASMYSTGLPKLRSAPACCPSTMA